MKTYQFHVTLPEAGEVWRKVELRADQTLHDLHYAIQAAFGWDADHLYSFFMSGEPWDTESEYTVLDERDEMPFGLSADEEEEDVPEIDLSNLPPGMLEEALSRLAGALDTTPEALRGALESFGIDLDASGGPGDSQATTLESLNLHEGDEFLYLFDYGDEWRFQVRCDGVYEMADPDLLYPRLVASEGADPPQYSDREDEASDED